MHGDFLWHDCRGDTPVPRPLLHLAWIMYQNGSPDSVFLSGPHRRSQRVKREGEALTVEKIKTKDVIG